MSENTKIEWATDTWNPMTGCTKVSPGCDHCYAETFAERWRGIPGHAYEQGFDLKLHPARLRKPYTWRNRLVFVNSMSDMFHRDIPDDYIRQVFQVMADTTFCPYRNTFQVLTKRPERMRRIMSSIWESVEPRDYARDTVMQSIWLGTSIESVDYAWRADMLRETPAKIRFLSLEPLLGHIPAVILKDMNWVIVGGESGHGARPMDPQWVRDIRDDCQVMGIPFFFKQWGGVHKKAAGRELDGREWNDYPSQLVAA
jgi:protein gp37